MGGHLKILGPNYFSTPPLKYNTLLGIYGATKRMLGGFVTFVLGTAIDIYIYTYLFIYLYRYIC